MSLDTLPTTRESLSLTPDNLGMSQASHVTHHQKRRIKLLIIIKKNLISFG